MTRPKERTTMNTQSKPSRLLPVLAALGARSGARPVRVRSHEGGGDQHRPRG